MADAPKTKSGSITGPEPTMTRWQARREVGWMTTIDFILLWGLGLIGPATLLWCAFGWPTAAALLGIGVGTVIYLLLWVILLLYRSMLFTLGVHADIQMLPVEAARIAVRQMTGLQGKQDEHPDAKS